MHTVALISCIITQQVYLGLCTAAVKRCYVGIRRNAIEHQEGKEEYLEDQAKRRKYRSRRQRVSSTIMHAVPLYDITCTPLPCIYRHLRDGELL